MFEHMFLLLFDNRNENVYGLLHLARFMFSQLSIAIINHNTLGLCHVVRHDVG